MESIFERGNPLSLRVFFVMMHMYTLVSYVRIEIHIWSVFRLFGTFYLQNGRQIFGHIERCALDGVENTLHFVGRWVFAL